MFCSILMQHVCVQGIWLNEEIPCVYGIGFGQRDQEAMFCRTSKSKKLLSTLLQHHSQLCDIIDLKL